MDGPVTYKDMNPVCKDIFVSALLGSMSHVHQSNFRYVRHLSQHAARDEVVLYMLCSC